MDGFTSDNKSSSEMISSQFPPIPTDMRKEDTNPANGLDCPSSPPSHLREDIVENERQDKGTATADDNIAPHSQKCEESDKHQDNTLITQGKTVPTRRGCCEENEEIYHGISFIKDHPEKTKRSAIIDYQEINRASDTEKLFKSHEALSFAKWKNNHIEKSNFISANALAIDWDLPNHKDSMPIWLRDPKMLKEFVEKILPKQLPRPNLFYITEHGIRLIWLLNKNIKKVEKYEHLLLRISADSGSDLGSSIATKIYRSAVHVNKFGLVINSFEPLNVDGYLSSQPIWACDGEKDSYTEALIKLGLSLGRQSTARCPIGDHGSGAGQNLIVYKNGLMCFSHHGWHSKREIIELAGMANTNALSLNDLARREVKRFAAKDDLIDMLSFEIKGRFPNFTGYEEKLAEIIFYFALKEQQTDPQWQLQLTYFHHDKYPRHLRDYCAGRYLRHFVHVENLMKQCAPTYNVTITDLRKMPLTTHEAAHLKKLVATFHFMETVEPQEEDDEERIVAHPTADLSRFINGESQAALKSPLYELYVHNRPVVGINSGWYVPEIGVPTKIVVPIPIYKGRIDIGIIQELISDLYKYFSFENAKEMVNSYLGYLVQPMICHLNPGQNPINSFAGPTHSGKGFLGNIFPGLLYCNQYGPGVYETSFKTNSYEFGVMMSNVSKYPYVFIDEIAFATKENLKIIDQLATQQMLEYRKMNIGYVSSPNHITCALAAIDKIFYDETKARLVDFRFLESTPDKIKDFYSKWKNNMPHLLAALYHQMLKVDFKSDIPSIANRRTGFAILKKALKEAFDLDVTYNIIQGPNDVLDLICRMHEDPSFSGRLTGNWTRYSPKNVLDAYNQNNRVPMKSEYIHGLLTTAIAYHSTEKHPSYCNDGYLADNGIRYHIKIADEGQGRGESKRKYIYVKKLDGQPNIGSGHSNVIEIRPTTSDKLSCSPCEGSDLPMVEVTE